MSFSPQSKVWIYQSDREFSNEEVSAIQQQLNHFTSEWKAHGHQLQARAEVLYHYFIVFIVDESAAGASGCSIDASVRIIKGLEIEYSVDLFNRFNMAYKVGDKVVSVNKEDFETLISIKKITPDSIVFNNLVQTLAEFETKWEVPFKDSWHQKVFADLL
ncbi:ABC transporter ATPase [Pedobacter sp. AW31-3R]|uniref:ABC transporter ATPase n=1 Tax=Pedobacter sp. AW31-3R TaxID=3445781 RepID=UPI003FA082FF